MLDKKINFIFYFIFIFITNLVAQVEQNSLNFHPPVKIPMLLSGNFGELRLDHFHSGIDIKTGGSIGKEIFAIEDGYISRIKITPNGYGKSLYLTHPNGYISVYAHLDKFEEHVNEYAKNAQYQKESHSINIFPDKNDLKVKKGQLIAFSGNTGGSSGPHLHFEIRDARTQNPLNPLKFNFNITDNIKPVIFNVILYPKDSKSTINKKYKKATLKTKGYNGIYHLADSSDIILWGKVGFGIEAFDYLNNSNNKCGIYEIKLYVDSVLTYRNELSEISFNETRYINSYMDYEAKLKRKKSIHKTFIEPNNKLHVYKESKNNGIFNFNDNKIHLIEFVLKDAYSNTSSLSFNIKSLKPDSSDITPINKEYAEAFPYDFENTFIRHDIKITFPKNTFYDSLYFEYAMIESKENSFAPIHYIHNVYTPVHKKFSLSLRTNNLPDTLREKAVIAWINEKNKFIGVDGEWNNGFVTTTTRNLGKYTVVVDTIPPVIKTLNLRSDNNNLSNQKSIRFKITDDIAGIKSYKGYINNHWVLFEYDKKNNYLFYTFDSKRLESENNYKLELYVTDKKNNIAVFHSEFYRD